MQSGTSHDGVNRRHFLAAGVVAFGLLLGSESQAKDLFETATDAGTFTILLAGMKSAGLAPILTGKGPVTLFAPTDDAFGKLPKGALETLFKPENRDKLRNILTYHLVMGKVTAHDLMGKRLEAATAQGGSLLIDGTKGLMVGDARVIRPDMVADNGFIHVIDTVLIPE